MGRRVRYHPLFDCDVREAARWYDQRSAGLGDAFVEVVRQGVADVIVKLNFSDLSQNGSSAESVGEIGPVRSVLTNLLATRRDPIASENREQRRGIILTLGK